MTFFTRLVVGVRAFRKLVLDPADPVNGPLFQQCVEYRLHRKLARLFRATAHGAQLLAARPRLNASTFCLRTMSALPVDSFGHAFAVYFGEHAIAPMAAAVEQATTDDDYVCARLREAHDVLHVITGYATDEIGEIELQWFNLGNLPFGPIPIIATLGALATGLRRRYGMKNIWRRLRAAYARGKQARFLADIVWEDFWTRPLADVRAFAQVAQVPAKGDEIVPIAEIQSLRCE